MIWIASSVLALMESKHASRAADVLLGMFVALTLVSVADSSISVMRSKQSMQLMGTDHDDSVPDNLLGDADIFEIYLGHVGSPAEELTRSREWEEFRRHLLGYARRLKLMDAQNDEIDRRLREQELWISFASLGTIALSLVFSKLGKAK